MPSSSTICALATPPGVGGLAVVRLSGPEAYQVAERVFRPATPGRQVAQARGYTALYGHVCAPPDFTQPIDETIALFFRAPKSYTGEDVVELSCHGGSAVSRLVLEACLQAGAEPAAAGEFTRRAFLSGRISLAQAEGVLAMIEAESRQGAAQAEAALSGALAKQLAGPKEALLALQSHLAAWTDFPEENVPELEPEALRAQLQGALDVLEELVRGYGTGAILRDGVDTVILGRPNVGKSTLLNRLAGFDRAIVADRAGTTRDVLEQAVQLGGVRLNLFDTAGLRKTEDTVEAEGVRRSYLQLEKAGLVLAVFDGSAPASPEDLALAERCRGRAALALLNKDDLTPLFDPAALTPYFGEENVLSLSAKSTESLPLLEKAVPRVLGLVHADPRAATLTSERQLAAAVRARDALREGLQAEQTGFGLDAVGVCVEDALDALYALTGENAGQAVVDEVFSRFCVGK